MKVLVNTMEGCFCAPFFTLEEYFYSFPEIDPIFISSDELQEEKEEITANCLKK